MMAKVCSRVLQKDPATHRFVLIRVGIVFDHVVVSLQSDFSLLIALTQKAMSMIHGHCVDTVISIKSIQCLCSLSKHLANLIFSTLIVTMVLHQTWRADSLKVCVSTLMVVILLSPSLAHTCSTYVVASDHTTPEPCLC